MKDVCQCCKKLAKRIKQVSIYYWRVDICKKCENKARKNGHIK